MGSLVLGVGGAILGNFLLPGIGGMIGGAIGSALGSVVDNLLFAPQGTSSDVQGPRLSDLSVMSSAYGSVIPALYGPNNRIGVNIIWSSGLIEDYHTETASSGGKGKGGKGGASQSRTTYTYRTHFAAAICEARPGAVLKRIYANKKVIYDAGAFSEMGTVSFYDGNSAQLPNFTLEAFLGAGNTPAYRGTCYMVITDLQLANFGNSLPNIEVEIQAHASINVGNVVQDLCERCGISTVSISGLTDAILGYGITSAVNVVGAIQPLALAYNFDASEQRGDVRFVKRGSAMKGVIGKEDMGAVASGDDRAEPINIELAPDVNLPNEVAVSYANIAFDYQRSTERERRTLGSSNNNLANDLPIVLTSAEAARIATRLMYEAWAARKSASFSFSEKWGALAPADVFGIIVQGEVVPFKLTRSTRGANGVYEAEARYEDVEVYSSLAPGQEPVLPPNIYVPPGDTDLILFNSPLLLPTNDDEGFYFAAGAYSSGWRGADILRSTDEGESYQPVASIANRSIVGTVAAALATGPVDFFDEGNTIDVVLDFPNDVLESISELSLLAGGNPCWLGDGVTGTDGEYIQYRNAQLVGPGTYRLSGLLRGRRGTEYATTLHGVDEKFIFLTSTTVGRKNYTSADWDRVRIYKGTTVFGDPIVTPPQDFTNTGEAKRPFSPVHVTGERDGANNLTINWVRRTRLFTPGIGYGDAPLGEASERYEVDVYLGLAVVRTISVTTATAAYSAAQQTADGYVAGAPIHVKVYQISDSRGRGHEADATV